MATYLELRSIVHDQTLNEKVQVAIADVAIDVLAEVPGTTTRKEWATAALRNPAAETPALLHYVLVANKAGTVAQILAASDTAVKTNIAAAVTAIYGP